MPDACRLFCRLVSPAAAAASAVSPAPRTPERYAVLPMTTAALNGGCVAFSGFAAERLLMYRRPDCAVVAVTQLTPTMNPTMALANRLRTRPPHGDAYVSCTCRVTGAGHARFSNTVHGTNHVISASSLDDLLIDA